MGTLSFQSDPTLPQGYLKIDGVTAATLTTAGISGVLYKPAAATNGQVLTYNGTSWVPGSINPSSFYTTVGNASAGIFVAAVCYIPSDPGTGTWTAPAGCYTARVTVVGGGGNATTAGGRSHFNYPSGTTTAANQLFAAGGHPGTYNGYDGNGGSAGWNGTNDVAIGGIGGVYYDPGDGNYIAGPGEGGKGGPRNGGVGGGGGGGGSVAPAAYVIGHGNYRFSGQGGGSFGRAGYGLGGGSGGISGDGSAGIPYKVSLTYLTVTAPPGGGGGGGTPLLSYPALMLYNFGLAIAQNVGIGSRGYSGGGGGWCSAIVSVIPGQTYSYGVGAAVGIGVSSSRAGYGMVVIEW